MGKIEQPKSAEFMSDLIDWQQFDDDMRPRWKKLIELKDVQPNTWKNIPPPIMLSSQTFNDSLKVIKHTIEMMIYKNKKMFEKVAQ